MYEIQVYIENARTPWIASGNLLREENNFATREEAQIKAILAEPSKLQRIAKLLEEK